MQRLEFRKDVHHSGALLMEESCLPKNFERKPLVGFIQIRTRRLKVFRHAIYCPPAGTLVVVAGTPATPGISSPRKYFAFAAFITGIAAYGFE